MTDYMYSSTDALVDSVYPVVIVDMSEASGGAGNANPPPGQLENTLETNVPNLYRLRFHDKLSTGRGEPEEASIVLERVPQSPDSRENATLLFTWPIEFIRRYGCETKNIFILELGRRCVGFPNKILRFDTRPAKASSLEGDFARLVKKVLKFMDPAAKALQKKQQQTGVGAFFSGLVKNQSPIVSNAASCEYAELAPYQPPSKGANKVEQNPSSEPSTHYARVIVNQP